MKKIISLFLAAVAVLGCSVLVSADDGKQSIYSSYIIPTGSMRMIAHRGYSSVAPENTLAAYRAAGESDFWGAECDIQRTKDGVWVLMHDDDVERTTDGTGNVTELTYAEICELTVDDGSNISEYPDEKVPTLTQYLDVCKEYGIHPVIEIKPNADIESLSEVAEILSAREEKAMFSVISFGRNICVRMKELMPVMPVYYLISNEGVSREDIDFAVNNHLDGIDFNMLLPEDYVKDVIKSGLDVIAWTVDDNYNAERLYKLGVRAITTNSLTQEKPEGSWWQVVVWKIRDCFYMIINFFKTVFTYAKVCDYTG